MRSLERVGAELAKAAAAPRSVFSREQGGVGGRRITIAIDLTIRRPSMGYVRAVRLALMTVAWAAETAGDELRRDQTARNATSTSSTAVYGAEYQRCGSAHHSAMIRPIAGVPRRPPPARWILDARCRWLPRHRDTPKPEKREAIGGSPWD